MNTPIHSAQEPPSATLAISLSSSVAKCAANSAGALPGLQEAISPSQVCQRFWNFAGFNWNLLCPMWSFIVVCIAPAHSSRTLTMSGFLQIVQMCISVSTHLQVVHSAESVSFHLCRYLLLRDMPHMLRTLILRSFSVSLSDQIFCIRRWSICSSALYVLWLSTVTIQENSSLLAMRVEEVIFCLVVVTNERMLPTMRSPLSAKENGHGTTDSSFQGAMGVGFRCFITISQRASAWKLPHSEKFQSFRFRFRSSTCDF